MVFQNCSGIAQTRQCCVCVCVKGGGGGRGDFLAGVCGSALQTLKRGCTQSRNTIGEWYNSGPPREQLLATTMSIEMHQSQPTIVVQMVLRNQLTSLPEEETCHVMRQMIIHLLLWLKSTGFMLLLEVLEKLWNLILDFKDA